MVFCSRFLLAAGKTIVKLFNAGNIARKPALLCFLHSRLSFLLSQLCILLNRTHV